ncbi:hypothetical protein EV188_108185 [Actinomycetospora succinea]|uniref:Uncharacterized protein n=1 Tax=Actinomycetospora succinea TaxID=663603 RepID=A0A4R6V6H1_9PSEU|nr:hypothetical protein [Actinomycetospora succinea]TDQ51824.1 hypothetical protein EV188_108185 [Actinomycetospora succinea]
MIALFRPPAAALALAVLAGGLLAGCSGGNSSSVSCSGTSCRATVTGAPIEVNQPEPGSGSGRSSTSRRPVNDGDAVDFRVESLAPGSVEVSDDGIVTRVPQGGTFVEDGSTVRLESSDGRTAVFTFQGR